jgi:hypothetical protein
MTPDNLYGYTPSLVASIVFILLFGILTVLHVKFRHVVVCLGGVLEISGYVVRIISRNNLGSVPLYAIQSLCILLAPCFFAASIYMTLGRLLRYLDQPQVSPIRTTWMTKIFVFGDIVSLLLQAGGGALQASGTDNMRKIGSNVVVGGLFTQLFFFGCFVVVCVVCHYRLTYVFPHSKIINNKLFGGSPVMGAEIQGKCKGNWQLLIIALYAGSILILIRSVYRVVEYVQGYDGYLLTHEIFLYLFDSLLMVLVMVVFAIVRPGDVMGTRASRSRSPWVNIDLEMNPKQ